jgi:acid phosphatase
VFYLNLSEHKTNIVQSAFKAIVDKYTPTNWKEQCRANLDQPATATGNVEPAGY